MNSMNENIVPYQSSSKTAFLVLGFLLLGWGTLFSIFLILQGAWPVTIFLGLEYILIVYLIRFYFKENKIKDILKRTFPNSKIPQKIRDLKIGDLKEWDSLGNFNLLLEIEKVFKCRIEKKSFNKNKLN